MTEYMGAVQETLLDALLRKLRSMSSKIVNWDCDGSLRVFCRTLVDCGQDAVN
jgi:hypothetical protein